MPTRSDELIRNYRELSEEIERLAREAGRDPKAIHLLAVSKTYPYADVDSLAAIGVRDFAENRPQELAAKIREENDRPAAEALRWHLIGSLQRNKIKLVLGRASLIHSVDSLRLLQDLNERAGRLEIRQPILLQINIAEEESKHGFRSNELAEAAAMAAAAEHLDFRGFMTMAPNFEDPEDAFPIFKSCHELFLQWQKELGSERITTLSMGMSNDFPQAIRAGATHLRVGSRIFGARHYSV